MYLIFECVWLVHFGFDHYSQFASGGQTPNCLLYWFLFTLNLCVSVGVCEWWFGLVFVRIFTATAQFEMTGAEIEYELEKKELNLCQLFSFSMLTG